MSQLDPVTVEIIRNTFITAAEDMNAALIRSAYTPVIYESKDCAVALIDTQHRVLGQSSGVPLFLGNLEACTRTTEELFGREVWEEGDIWILNDAYIQGTHMHDVSVYAPIFYRGDLAGFAASRAHWLDIGAKDPGVPMNATEIYQEGIRLGPTRIVAAGVPDAGLIRMLEHNVRFPVGAIGDLHSQFAVSAIGTKRLTALLDRYGPDTIRQAAIEIFAQSEVLDRQAIAAIPDGRYEAEGFLDNDLIGTAPFRIHVQIEVRGESMVVDLTDCSGPAAGPLNVGAVQTISAVRLAFKYIINSDVPVSGGTFRPLEVVIRPGSLLGAQEPSPCQFYFTPLGLLIDLFIKALAPAFPDTSPAGSYGDGMIMQLNGTDPVTGKRFLENEPHVGGWGASRGRDGEHGMIWQASGNFHDMPIEVFESKFPARISEYGFRTDSCGAGAWRGGCGIIREYVLDSDDGELSLWFDRSLTPGWGLFGGLDGAPPRVIVNPGQEDQRDYLKISRLPLRKGDVFRCMSGGGGGFGEPRDRDVRAIEDDLADGFISEDYARIHHGYRR